MSGKIKGNTNTFSSKITRVIKKAFFDWVVCRPISDHVMILLRILPFKFSNSRVHMNKQFFFIKNIQFSREYHLVCNGKTNSPSEYKTRD